jgi:hypothetical protein
MGRDNAKEKLHKWIDEKLEGAASLTPKELADAAEKDNTLGGNLNFVRAFTRQFFRTTLYDEIQRYLSKPRQDVARLGGGLVLDPGRLDEATDSIVEKIWGRWDRVYERVGDRHMRVIDMKSDDLGTAISRRGAQAHAHARWADFFAQLRTGLGKKRVRDKYTAQQLDNAWQEVTAAAEGVAS